MESTALLSDEHLKAIGFVAVSATHLDHGIEFLLAHLFIPNSKTAKALIADMNQDRQVRLMRVMLLDQFPEHEKKIEAFIDAIHKARDDRHDIIHYVWLGTMDEKGAAQMATMRVYKEPKEKSMTAKDVLAVAEKLRVCSKDIGTVLTWYTETVLPQRDKHARQSPPPSFPWPLTHGS